MTPAAGGGRVDRLAIPFEADSFETIVCAAHGALVKWSDRKTGGF